MRCCSMFTIWRYSHKNFLISLLFEPMRYSYLIRYGVITFFVLFVLNYFGVIDRLIREASYSEFYYPLEIDVRDQLHRIRRGHDLQFSYITDTNRYKVLINERDKCLLEKEIYLLILIKSAVPDFEARQAIRASWAQDRTVSFFSSPPRIIRHMFLLGTDAVDRTLNEMVRSESTRYRDIIQHDFVDRYYNNTLKTLTGLKWAVQNCREARFILFIDDDYHLCVPNVFKFLDSLTDAEINRLYAGFRFFTNPMRHRSSLFYVSIDQYKFNRYPPYITAGAYLLSHQSATDFYEASQFVKLFPFDDVYMGIIARKLDIDPQHNDNFLFWPESFDADKYKDIIAAHGFRDLDMLEEAYTNCENRNRKFDSKL